MDFIDLLFHGIKTLRSIRWNGVSAHGGVRKVYAHTCWAVIALGLNPCSYRVASDVNLFAQMLRPLG